MNLKPPEKKKRKKNPSPPPLSPSLSLLPDEISVNCLARISRAHYPTLSIVSKSFRSILSSAELYAARSQIGSTEQCLYVCLSDESYQFPQWSTLWINPNRTLPKPKKKKKKIEKLLVPIPSSDFASTSKSSVVVVGPEIYIIGGPVERAPSSAVRVLDCRSHAWRDAPSMTVARKHALACVYGGKIYVVGGSEEDDEPWAEVFDTKTQTWERLPDPGTEIRNHVFHRIAEEQGKIHIWNSNRTYAYDPNQDKWECCLGKIATTYIPVSGCVMEGVWYDYHYGLYHCSGTKSGSREDVKGLDSLGEMYRRNGGSSSNTAKLVSCGGKLLLVWEGYKKHNPNNRKKIWCAEIALRKDDEGVVWGDVEWVDVVQTVPRLCKLLHCLVVSV